MPVPMVMMRSTPASLARARTGLEIFREVRVVEMGVGVDQHGVLSFKFVRF